MSSKVAVIGDGWAALGAVGFLAQAGTEVEWISGTVPRVDAPLPTIEAGPGVISWRDLASRLGVEAGQVQTGSYLREFRNKSFRESPWTKAPTPDTRREVRDESLWSAERAIAPAFEARFEQTLGDLEPQLRAKLAELPNVKRTENTPISGFRIEDGQVKAVILASGDEIACDRAIYADRWSNLVGMAGLPKPLSFIRNREPMGVLQAVFTHLSPIGSENMREAFYSALHKEAGEEVQRNVWGYFMAGGRCSVWSVILTQSEVEDNHEIAKKLRRMKQALDRMFTGSEWLPEGKKEFTSTVSGEQIRFAEGIVFGEGKAPEAPITLPKAAGLEFITDGYGPSSALHQAALAAGESAGVSAEAIQQQANELIGLTQ
jgi:hypothetical protein